MMMRKETKQLESAATEAHMPRLFVFPRLDLVRVDSAGDTERVVHDLKHMHAEAFETEKAAEEFHGQHLRTHHAPIYLASLADRQGPPFTKQHFSQYHTVPAGSGVRMGIDFILDSPIRCTLADDWQLGSVAILMTENTSHKTVRRHTAQPARELVEFLHGVEAALYTFHTHLSRDAVKVFWSSFEVHRYLTVHALEMGRYRADYAESIDTALDYARRHIADYLSDVVLADEASAPRTRVHVSFARKIQCLKADANATVQELEDLFNLDRKTLRRVELGNLILQSTVNKAQASEDSLEQLTRRLLENRKRRCRMK
jgi:hypothetical protein